MKTSIHELMVRSGVAFGTSGARGLATAMTDQVCYAYTKGFLQYLEGIGELKRAGERVAVGGDFRPSTDRVMAAVCRAADDMGYRAVNCGKVPSPAVALFGLENKIPSIMVTGSHIPDDRNGIKFNKATGEVLKEDEKGMSIQVVELDDALFGADGNFGTPASSTARSNFNNQRAVPEAGVPREVSPVAGENYVMRYLNFFSHDALKGLRVGVYQHSAVGRDVLVKILSHLGAEVTPLGRSEKFIPVDTEAIRPEDVQLAHDWAATGKYDALVSADGDSDRPLISDEKGNWLRGDVAGILCAKFLEADSISTPVSCNTAVEKCGWFKEIRRTRIGSPFVVASMMQATAGGAKRVVGYEANGGFLLNSNIFCRSRGDEAQTKNKSETPHVVSYNFESSATPGAKFLRALPTRDAVIVMIGILLLAKAQKKTVSQLAATLPARFTASDRLKDFATEKSVAILAQFNSGSEAADKAAIEKMFGAICGQVAGLNRTDGLRITFTNEEVIHLRPSGNAPEFRCYAEAATDDRAREITALALAAVRG
ncbi:MAG TPA: phosphomannomutase [Verrucomicrobiae bacterium]